MKLVSQPQTTKYMKELPNDLRSNKRAKKGAERTSKSAVSEKDGRHKVSK